MAKALVIGQGGREHALVRALRLSPSVEMVYAAPGSDGIRADDAVPGAVPGTVPGAARVHAIGTDPRETRDLQQLIKNEGIDYVVIGPEVPLVEGLADQLRAAGIATVGPSRAAAQLEGSKVYSKEFMVQAGVPTARSQEVRTVREVKTAARLYSPPYVLKADGLAAGKGVFICANENELENAARALFEEQTLGAAGQVALLEEFQRGYEISYLVLTNGETFEPLVLAQDHKRLKDEDRGPNTGGMGVVAPVAIDESLRQVIDKRIVIPTLREMQRRGLLYRGILYIGLMITPEGPSVIEYNVRFGDPEAQVILPLLDGDWGEVFAALANGRLLPLRWKAAAAACVVIAAEGYPDNPVKGTVISGLREGSGEVSSLDRYVLHAGTKRRGEWVTDGGRVLNCVGLGSTLKDAVSAAYAQAREVEFRGMQLRTDIGAKLLITSSNEG